MSKAFLAADAIASSYRGDPAGYAKWYLGRALTAKQQECQRKLLEPPYRVLCRSANNVGKTFVSACTASWWHDTFRPSIVLTTAPTQTQVKDLLFKELRSIRPLKEGMLPKATRVERRHDWYIHGFTTTTADAFQGRHAERLLLIFDEATGIRRDFWERAETMFAGHEGHGWLAIYNPNDTSSPPFIYEQREGWHNVHITALEHPNIASELAGLDPPVPSAIRLSRVLSRIESECERVSGEPTLHDFEFPFGSGVFYTPISPEFEVQILGRWPTKPVNAVWADNLWRRVNEPRYAEIQPHWTTQIGCDVARFGDDETTIHVRRGPCSVLHEWHKGWGTDRTAARLKELCHHYCGPERPTAVKVAIDSGGIGGGVVDQSNGYNFLSVNPSRKASMEDRYSNVRSELWFVAVDLAREGLIDLTRLSGEALNRLRVELQAPTYQLDTLSRRVIEAKDRTKARLGKSPDNADAMNLAYYMV